MAKLARAAEKTDEQQQADPNFFRALVISDSAQNAGQPFRGRYRGTRSGGRRCQRFREVGGRIALGTPGSDAILENSAQRGPQAPCRMEPLARLDTPKSLQN